MEAGPASRLTARKRRAVALIAISVLALAVAGLTWIVPTLHVRDAANSKTTGANPVSTTPSPPPVFPTMYDFATPSAGWAVVALSAGTKVFKTVDAGKHWRLSSRLAGSVGANIQFLDTTHGFVVTYSPSWLYRTTDGGAHWTQLAMPEGSTYGITFTDRRRGSSRVPPLVPGGRPDVYTTDDGGDTWQHRDLPPDSYDPVFRIAEAWAGANASPPGRLHVFASFDRGLSWSPVDVPRPPASQSVPAGESFFSAQVRLLPGAGVAVLVTVVPVCPRASAKCNSMQADNAQFVSFDRGRTWTEIPLPPAGANAFLDVAYQDAFHWWMLGSGSLFKSSDAGQTWQLVASTLPAPPEGRLVLRVFDAQHAWVQASLYVDRNVQTSAAAITNDGGLSWTKVPPPML